MDQKEINKILIDNKRMIELIANKSYYEKYKTYIDKEDFIQEAFFYASKFLKKYDKRKGTLSTFLYANLSKELMRYGNSNLSMVHIPNHICEIIRKIKKYCDLNNINTDTISDDIIYKFTSDKSRSVDIIKKILVYGYTCKHLDFDSVLELDDYTERYNDMDEKIDNEIARNKINKALSSEKKRDIEIIKGFYYNDLPLKDLGVRHNLSDRGTWECINRVKLRLRKKLINYKEDLLND